MVYADVLVFLNLIINYFLLLAASKILRRTPKTWRMVCGALVGAASSLYIFLPPLVFAVETILKLAVCIIMCIVSFGFNGFRNFFKGVLALFGVTVGFGGLMYAVWLLFNPNGMVINNSVVYFDISIFALLGFTILGYILFSFLFKIFSHTAPFSQSCDVIIYSNGRSITLLGMVDTGNSIEDIFLQGEILICDETVKKKLFGAADIKNNDLLKTRYRLLPCNTVSGMDVLEGVRCDSATIKYEGKSITLKKPILAFSKTKLSDHEVIINPKILG